MGLAIKRPDGTYRCWNANTQDDILQLGEIWEAHVANPGTTAPPSSPSALRLALDNAITNPSLDSTLRQVLIELRNRESP